MNLSRRDLLKRSAQSCLVAGCTPLSSLLLQQVPAGSSVSTRCINVVNFIRGVEPRMPTDLLLPVQKQMELILEHRLPATWLLQYDALVSGAFVAFLKAQMTSEQEVGFWFEMNEKLCDAAGVAWRGRPGFEWDSEPPVAFTIGYSKAERVKLADAAMQTFKATFGHFPRAVASWNLDSISMAHLSEQYGVDAFAVCRDQIATDGFTIWGAPIAGYYPSKVNCWSPALNVRNQIHTPVFRMLGQDPVYYYQRGYPTPDGRRITEPDTMEPVWNSGRSPGFVAGFLNMISKEPCLEFAYAQLGQENSFGWPEMEAAYPAQMMALAKLRDSGSVHVETLSETGRRFKRAFSTTPVQAQVQLQDPFSNTAPAERSIWYQSRFYRSNLHLSGDLPFFRDITVYSDRFPQPFLTSATRDKNVEQRMPAVLDGYHWSAHPGSRSEAGAGGYFSIAGKLLRLNGKAHVFEAGSALVADLPLTGKGTLRVRFEEQDISIILPSSTEGPLTLSFQWDPDKAALVEIQPDRIAYRWQGCNYYLAVHEGQVNSTATGFSVTQGNGGIRLGLAQAS